MPSLIVICIPDLIIQNLLPCLSSIHNMQNLAPSSKGLFAMPIEGKYQCNTLFLNCYENCSNRVGAEDILVKVIFIAFYMKKNLILYLRRLHE